MRFIKVALVFFSLVPVVAGHEIENFSLEHDGHIRHYHLRIPADFPTSAAPLPLPLLVDLHGGGVFWSDHMHTSRFGPITDNEGSGSGSAAIIAYPEGLDAGWNGGTAGCQLVATDDVGFLRQIVAQVSSKFNISQVYSTGHSCGCIMSHLFAKNASDVVDAQACFAGYLAGNDPGFSPILSPLFPVPEYQPTSQMVVHGTRDPMLPYNGVAGGSASAMENFETLRALNGCTGDPTEVWRSDESYQLTYASCSDGVQTSLLTMAGGGHQPYLSAGETNGIDTTLMVWEFLSKFLKSTAAPLDPTASSTSTSISTSRSASTSRSLPPKVDPISDLQSVLPRNALFIQDPDQGQ